jgi:hypothetical protein
MLRYCAKHFVQYFAACTRCLYLRLLGIYQLLVVPAGDYIASIPTSIVALIARCNEVAFILNLVVTWGGPFVDQVLNSCLLGVCTSAVCRHPDTAIVAPAFLPSY